MMKSPAGRAGIPSRGPRRARREHCVTLWWSDNLIGDLWATSLHTLSFPGVARSSIARKAHACLSTAEGRRRQGAEKLLGCPEWLIGADHQLTNAVASAGVRCLLCRRQCTSTRRGPARLRMERCPLPATLEAVAAC